MVPMVCNPGAAVSTAGMALAVMAAVAVSPFTGGVKASSRWGVPVIMMRSSGLG